jgi:hypothetical protein
MAIMHGIDKRIEYRTEVYSVILTLACCIQFKSSEKEDITVKEYRMFRAEWLMWLI